MTTCGLAAAAAAAAAGAGAVTVAAAGPAPAAAAAAVALLPGAESLPADTITTGLRSHTILSPEFAIRRSPVEEPNGGRQERVLPEPSALVGVVLVGVQPLPRVALFCVGHGGHCPSRIVEASSSWKPRANSRAECQSRVPIADPHFAMEFYAV